MMAFDPQSVRHPERIYLTQDCLDALRLVKPCDQHRDKWIEEVLWQALSKIPGVVDCVTARKEALRKFKEQQKPEDE